MDTNSKLARFVLVPVVIIFLIACLIVPLVIAGTHEEPPKPRAHVSGKALWDIYHDAYSASMATNIYPSTAHLRAMEAVRSAPERIYELKQAIEANDEPPK